MLLNPGPIVDGPFDLLSDPNSNHTPCDHNIVLEPIISSPPSSVYSSPPLDSPSAPLPVIHPMPQPVSLSFPTHPQHLPEPQPDDPLLVSSCCPNDLLPIPLSIDLPPLPYIPPLPLESQPIFVLNQSIEASSSISGSDGGDSALSVGLGEPNSGSFWTDPSISKEEKIWLLATKTGVNGNDNDQLFIRKIKEMEGRDKEAKRKMENQSGPQ